MAEQKRRLSPVHPTLAAAWKEQFRERKVIELMMITEIDEQLADDFIDYLMSSHEQLVHDINGTSK